MAPGQTTAPTTERTRPTRPANRKCGDNMITPGYNQGDSDREGRSVSVQSIFGDKTKTVILSCDGGNCRFQHNMTPDEARELSGYLQAEANYCDSMVTA